MDEAEVLQTDGALRVLFGLAVTDLLIGAAVAIIGIKFLPLSGIFNLVVSAALAWAAAQASARWRRVLPFESVRQYLLWLTQPDLLEPGIDADAKPLVIDLPEQATLGRRVQKTPESAKGED